MLKQFGQPAYPDPMDEQDHWDRLFDEVHGRFEDTIPDENITEQDLLDEYDNECLVD
jgi:hypothetical protein